MGFFRRRFGPLLYITLFGAGLALLGVYGGMSVRPYVEGIWKFRTLENQWRDAGRSKSGREAAAAKLVEFGPAAVRPLLAVGNDPGDPLRSTAFVYLAKINPPAQEAIAGCIAILKSDNDPQVRRSAVELLATAAAPGRVNSDKERHEIIDSLLAARSDPDPKVRAAVMHALVFAKDAGPDLTASLNDSRSGCAPGGCDGNSSDRFNEEGPCYTGVADDCR